MSIQFDLQIATTTTPLPSKTDFTLWLAAALNDSNKVLNIRIVDSEEMTEYNATYRKKNAPTNVLAFPFVPINDAHNDILGDIVMCAPVIQTEAKAADKEILDHFAHLTIHATLHLLGYDHQNEADTQKMQAKEIKLLKTLSIANPYQKHLKKESP